MELVCILYVELLYSNFVIIAKNWKQPRHLSVDEWISKLRIHPDHRVLFSAENK